MPSKFQRKNETIQITQAKPRVVANENLGDPRLQQGNVYLQQNDRHRACRQKRINTVRTKRKRTRLMKKTRRIREGWGKRQQDKIKKKNKRKSRGSTLASLSSRVTETKISVSRQKEQTGGTQGVSKQTASKPI